MPSNTIDTKVHTHTHTHSLSLSLSLSLYICVCVLRTIPPSPSTQNRYGPILSQIQVGLHIGISFIFTIYQYPFHIVVAVDVSNQLAITPMYHSFLLSVSSDGQPYYG